MGFRFKGSIFRLGYAFCSLVYMAWVVHLSCHNFEMVHNDYRRAAAQLQPARIEAIAEKELVAQCRKESRQNNRILSSEDPCRSWSEATLEARQKVVGERLLAQQSQAVQKLVFFYLSFGLFFLILPPLLLYLFLSLFVWLFRNLKVA